MNRRSIKTNRPLFTLRSRRALPYRPNTLAFAPRTDRSSRYYEKICHASPRRSAASTLFLLLCYCWSGPPHDLFAVWYTGKARVSEERCCWRTVPCGLWLHHDPSILLRAAGFSCRLPCHGHQTDVWLVLKSLNAPAIQPDGASELDQCVYSCWTNPHSPEWIL